METINEEYLVPKEYISCPGCGNMYGHHNTKVCLNCEECSKCCWCEERGEEKNWKSAKEAIPIIIKRN